MSRMLQHLLVHARSVVLGAWLLALVYLVSGRRYETYLHPAFGAMLALGAVALLAALVGELGRGNRDPLPGGLGRLLILLSPLACMTVVGGVSLGAKDFEQRWTGFASRSGYETAPPLARAEALLAHGVWPVSLRDLMYAAPEYTGRRVAVEGWFKRTDGPEWGQDVGVLYRFLIRCCAADAVPAAVLLDGPVAPDVESGAWIRIEGVFSLEPRGDDVIPVIRVEQAQYTEPPPNTYLY